MNAVVLLRAVPDREALAEPAPVVLDASSMVALGLALSLRTVDPSLTVTGIAAGPAEWDVPLRDALALELSSVLRFESPPEADLITNVAAIARSIPQGTSFVIAGSAATDHGSGLLPSALAEALDWPHIASVTAVERDGGGLVMRVRGAAGARRLLRLLLPCVLEAAPAPAPPLYPRLAKKLAARKAQIPVAGFDGGPTRLRLDGYGPARPVTRTLFRPSTSARPAERMRQLMAGGMSKRSGQTMSGDGGIATQLADLIEAQGFLQRPQG